MHNKQTDKSVLIIYTNLHHCVHPEAFRMISTARNGYKLVVRNLTNFFVV